MAPKTKKIVDLKARVILDDQRYPCIIESLSENEIGALTSCPEGLDCYQEGSPLKLQFTPQSGELIDIDGSIKSSFKTPPYGITKNIVVKLDSPPYQYMNLLHSL